MQPGAGVVRLALRLALVASASVVGTGCRFVPMAPPPTAEELATADYGECPDLEVVKPAIISLLEPRLIEPATARLRWGTPKKSWFREGRDPETHTSAREFSPRRFAWVIPVWVDAKNAKGWHEGERPWRFYAKGNEVIGLGWQKTEASWYSGIGTYWIYDDFTFDQAAMLRALEHAASVSPDPSPSR